MKGPNLKLVQLMASLSINHKNLAKVTGVSPELISDICAGKTQPDVEKAIAISQALNVSVEDLFGDQPEHHLICRDCGEPIGVIWGEIMDDANQVSCVTCFGRIIQGELDPAGPRNG